MLGDVGGYLKVVSNGEARIVSSNGDLSVGPCCMSPLPSACSPTVAALPAVFWLTGTVGIASLCGVDRLVTMAKSNTVLYGSQMVAEAEGISLW